SEPRLQLAHDVVDRFTEDRAVANEIVSAATARIERRARHREDIAPLLEGETRGNERTRTQRGLNDQHAERAAGDDAIAAREMARLRLGTDRQLGDQRAALGDLLVQPTILFRIDLIDP